MTAALVSITLRALLNRRRTLLLALVGVLFVAISALYQLSNPDPEQSLLVTRRLLADLALGVGLPLVAVIVGTAAIGSELDDGTVVYLLAKPVPRWLILVVKLLVAWLVTSLLVVPALVVAAVIGTGDAGLATGFALAGILASLEYTAIFVALSLVTGRALVIGLAYVVVWEGIVASLFAGTRPLSVRQHALALAEATGGADAEGLGAIDLPVALVAAALVIAGATVIAIRRLETVELRGETG